MRFTLEQTQFAQDLQDAMGPLEVRDAVRRARGDILGASGMLNPLDRAAIAFMRSSGTLGADGMPAPATEAFAEGLVQFACAERILGGVREETAAGSLSPALQKQLGHYNSVDSRYTSHVIKSIADDYFMAREAASDPAQSASARATAARQSEALALAFEHVGEPKGTGSTNSARCLTPEGDVVPASDYKLQLIGRAMAETATSGTPDAAVRGAAAQKLAGQLGYEVQVKIAEPPAVKAARTEVIERPATPPVASTRRAAATRPTSAAPRPEASPAGAGKSARRVIAAAAAGTTAAVIIVATPTSASAATRPEGITTPGPQNTTSLVVEAASQLNPSNSGDRNQFAAVVQTPEATVPPATGGAVATVMALANKVVNAVTNTPEITAGAPTPTAADNIKFAAVVTDKSMPQGPLTVSPPLTAAVTDEGGVNAYILPAPLSSETTSVAPDAGVPTIVPPTVDGGTTQVAPTTPENQSQAAAPATTDPSSTLVQTSPEVQQGSVVAPNPNQSPDSQTAGSATTQTDPSQTPEGQAPDGSTAQAQDGSSLSVNLSPDSISPIDLGANGAVVLPPLSDGADSAATPPTPETQPASPQTPQSPQTPSTSPSQPAPAQTPQQAQPAPQTPETNTPAATTAPAEQKPASTPEKLTEKQEWLKALDTLEKSGPNWKNRAIVMKAFIDAGYTPWQAAGFVGGFVVESAGIQLDPAKKQYGGGPGRGIAQWGSFNPAYDRFGFQEPYKYGTLLWYAQKLGNKDWRDINVQASFVIWELKNTEKAAGKALAAAKNVHEAANVAMNDYERPKVRILGLRGTYANDTYTDFVGALKDVRTAEAKVAPKVTPAIAPAEKGINKTPNKLPIAQIAKGERTPSEAIAWAKKQVDTNSSGWALYCLKFVSNAYGINALYNGYDNGKPVSYAMNVFKNIPANERGSADTPLNEIPVGALLFWDTGSAAGHVALYVGNGMIISTDIKQAGHAAEVPFDEIQKKWNGIFKGWANPSAIIEARI